MENRDKDNMDIEELRSKVRERFAIDTRALAAFRISLGLLLLADLLLRSRDLVAFYTDSGVLPRQALQEHSSFLYSISLHTLSGDAWFQALLFVIAGVLALSLLFGYRTRTVTVASWVLLVSLHARNPVLLNGGDSLLRRLLFWSVFLPLGEKWSVDAVRKDSQKQQVTNLASAALLLQVVMIYTVNAIFKLRGEIWTNGEAILYVFSLDQLTVLFGDILSQYPDLLVFLNYVWLVMVIFSAGLILLRGRSRAVFASLFVVMHLGMLLTMNLGLFPLISIAGLIPFLPREVWDRVPTSRLYKWTDGVRERLKGSGQRASILNVSVPTQWKSRFTSTLVAVLLVTIIIWNGAALGYVNLPQDDIPVSPTDRTWDMFAEPRNIDGWYVVPGKLKSGGEIDAFYRSPVDWDRPPDIAQKFPNQRWLVYLVDLTREEYSELRPYFAQYLCRRWNSEHGDQDKLTKVTVYYMKQPTRLNGPEPIQRENLGTYSCFS